DVYSLGTMLFELLVGALPRRSRAEALRQLDGDPLPFPSRRLSELDSDRAEELARRRRVRAATLVRELRGELDWIVSKALAAAPEDRYSGAAVLAEDLSRYLTGEAVWAGPPALSYRVARLARRHRALVTAAVLALATLVGGLLSTSWQARRAAREAAMAQEARREAEQVTEFLEGLFELSDPERARGSTITARDILDRGAERLQRELAGQPEAQTRLQDRVAEIYRRLGFFEKARSLAERSLALRRDLLGDQHQATAESLRTLAAIRIDEDLAESALPLLEEAIAIQGERLGPEHLEMAETLDLLAQAFLRTGRADQAVAAYRRSYDIVARSLPPEQPRRILSLANLAVSHDVLRDWETAERLFRQALEQAEEHLGIDHPEVFRIRTRFANHYLSRDRNREAAAVLEPMIPRLSRVLGAAHSHTLNIRLNLAMAYVGSGEIERARREALGCLEEILEARSLQPQLTIRATQVLGDIAFRQGDYEEARALHEQGLEVASTLEAPAML
ncbi:MAG: tetratricopeptide repeat protein, partial [Acidobacteria bacterium]|nr:tetratricopeptide repeat protein [Acidobacteriota bacterium]